MACKLRLRQLAAAPFPTPAPNPLPSSITALDTFLVVRADGPADATAITATYYYLAQPSHWKQSNNNLLPAFFFLD